MSSLNSRSKGKRGEREWCEYLRSNFDLKARRGQQYAGGTDSPDVVGGFGGTHCEVKRVERLNIDKAMQQAISDCGDLVPYVAHRRNQCDWLVTVRADDLRNFAASVVATITGGVFTIE